MAKRKRPPGSKKKAQQPKKPKHTPQDQPPVVFQTFTDHDDEDANFKYFELASKKRVAFACRDTANSVVVEQFPDVENCNGGIVWETAYLLATYLQAHEEEYLSKCDGILEVGSGCGLLGLVLAAMKKGRVPTFLTEATEAMDHLGKNVDANVEWMKEAFPEAKRLPEAHLLRWGNATDLDACERAFQGTKFSLVVGTDVIFNVDLVKPLLETMHRFANKSTTVLLCLQQRCVASHEKLLQLIPGFFELEDITSALVETTGCKEAEEMECVLLRLTGKKRCVIAAAQVGAKSIESL